MFGQRGAEKKSFFIELIEKKQKKSQLTLMKREAGSFVNASNTGFTIKPPGTMPSVAKHFFGRACRKKCCNNSKNE